MSFQTRLGRYSVVTHNQKEYHSIKREIFNEEIYHFHSKSDSPLIIDIGSHVGLSVLYFKSLYPDAKIIAFEPDPESYSLLLENIEANDLSSVEAIDAAVRSFTGTTDLYVGEEEDWRSNSRLASRSWDGSTKLKNRVSVNCIKLSSFLKDIEVIDLVKIDVEGFEKELLGELSRSSAVLHNLIVEVHDDSSSNIRKLTQLINSCGFDGVDVDKAGQKGLLMMSAPSK